MENTGFSPARQTQAITSSIRMMLCGLLSGLLFLSPVGLMAQQDSSIEQSVEKPVDAEMQKRIELLQERMEAARKKMHIPGMALAVVKDGEIIFARGFGVCDVENSKPVTPETIFAIGSSTKAFTATLIGMLQDDKKIGFDDPVIQHLPEFTLDVDTEDQAITIRDMLSHRTGFTRMSLLWAGGKLTRPEVIEYAASAKPTKSFRKDWQYNNVMYMIAGYCAGIATDSTWEDQIAERIFKPLGMASSNTSVELSQKDDRLSRGYSWDSDNEEYTVLPMRNLDLIGPAGSINSNIIDMSQWLKFQLAKGEINGQRLISKDTHADTWTKQMDMDGSGAGYGLGWMLREWDDKQVVEHGGNIDGFGAQVTLLPEENMGYVLLCNVTATPLQGSSIATVFDTLLGDLEEDADESESAPTEGLIGKYVANFGQFKDTIFEVSIQDGNLAVDVPGQMVFELKQPDEEGKWYFALTDTIAVSFATEDDGKANSMTMYQAGMEFECLREGVVPKPEVPLETLRPLLGIYKDEDDGKTVKIIIQNNRLAADPGSQSAIEFLPPDDDGFWAMRANKDFLKLRFNKVEDGTVESITRIQGGKEVELKRIGNLEESDSATLPSGEEILKKIYSNYDPEKIRSMGHYQLNGHLKYVHQGVDGKATMFFSGASSYMNRMDMGKLGAIDSSVDEDNGWVASNISPFEKLSGAALTSAKLHHPLWIAGDWQSFHEMPTVLEKTMEDERETFAVKFSGKDDTPDRTIYVDAETGHIVKEDTSVLVQNVMQLPITIEYSDFRQVGPIMLPFKMTTENAMVGDLVMQFDSATKLDEKPNYMLVDPATSKDQ